VAKGEARRNMHDMIMEFSPFLYVFLLLGAAIATAVALTGVIINVDEREVEIGTLMTLGASDRFVMATALLENAFLGLMGGVLALLLGHEVSRLTLRAFSTGMFTTILHIPWHLDMLFYLLSVGLAMLATTLLWPRVRGLPLPQIVREVSR